MNTKESNIYFISLLFGLCFFYNYTSAQISYGGEPYFITNTNQSSIKKVKSINNIEIKTFKVEDLNMDKVYDELDSLNRNCKNCNSSFYYGKEVDVKIDFFKIAQNIGIIDSDSIWLLKIESDSAKGFQLIFDKFQIPKGGRLFVYNEEHTMVLGSFTSENNRVDSTFITQNINGKSIYIEYVSPSNELKNNFFIDKIVYIFDNNFTGYKGPFSIDGSASCQINTTCPEATGFDVEVKSTALILEKPLGSQSFWGVCSGALINDGTNYIGNNNVLFLTSNHCYESMENNESTYSNTNNWLFLFRHEASSCQSNGSDISNNTTKSVLGATVRFRDEHSKGADYLLLELKCKVSDISKYDIAFAGYDYNNNFIMPGSLGSPAVNIHHPKGDVKKITKYEKTATNERWNDNANDDDHWKMEATTGYKTEPGSSGSPLFNNKHQIIGICHGGSDKTDTNPQELITCSSEKKWWNTYFGKLSDASIRNNIQYYLFGSTSDPYTPPENNTSTPNPSNFKLTSYQIYAKQQYDKAVISEPINVEAEISNIPSTIIGQQVQWTLTINKLPGDMKSDYLCSEVDKVYCQTGYSNVFQYTTSINKANYKFTNFATLNVKGYYYVSLKIKVALGRRDAYEEFEKVLTLNIDDRQNSCARIDFEVCNPKKRYIPGESIWIKESIDLVDEFTRNNYDYCRPNGIRNPLEPSGGWTPNFWDVPKWIGVGKLTWKNNNTIVETSVFNTTARYSDVCPGTYYQQPTNFREFVFNSAGLNNLQLVVSPGGWSEWTFLEAYEPPIPNVSYPFYVTDLFPDYPDYYASKSQQFIVVDCDGHKIVNQANDPLILDKASLTKDIGVGTIEIENVELKNNNYSVVAFKSIILKPGTTIKSEGGSFSAKITPCSEISNSSNTPTCNLSQPQMIIKYKDEKSNKNITEKNSLTSIIVYPNPTSGVVNIKLPQDFKIFNIKLYDINGQLLKMESFNTNQIFLNLSDLNLYNGFYILRIFSSNGESNHKILFKNVAI